MNFISLTVELKILIYQVYQIFEWIDQFVKLGPNISL
jgi:hypothetical protein